jgi:hypothetical protein
MQEVGGSIPPGSTILLNLQQIFQRPAKGAATLLDPAFQQPAASEHD